ncbi:MAG TPA: beta-N-acetylhexosaminidase, partial [Chloroflexota bacterium]|nr:beta-N-acetylhexosaminidase [Chloroflexota bacterium]
MDASARASRCGRPLRHVLRSAKITVATVVSVALSACSPAAPPPATAPPWVEATAQSATATGAVASGGSTATATAIGQNGPAVSATQASQSNPSSQSSRSAAPAATPTPSDVAHQTLAKMTLEQRVGQVFMLGFVGTALNDANRALIGGLHLGGVTLFGRNIDSGSQLATLDAALQTIADPVPLFISVDQEGGLVVRVTDGATIFPGNMALGATSDPSLARRVAEASAAELLAMGVNMDLAPVVDVNTNPLNPVIGVRSFGSTPEFVSQFATQTIAGLQSSGVSAVGKHFPGHGDTAVDSHRDLPVVLHSRERLDLIELQPFRAAMEAGVDGIMTAHLYVPSIESRQDVPATLSKTVLTGLLREQLGFNGLILTDALDMDAIKKDRSAAEAAVEAFEAGADMLLIAGINADDRAHLSEGPPALLAAVKSGRISEERLNQSVLRILEAKAKRGILAGAVARPPTPSATVLNSAEHRALALDAARQAVTLQRDSEGLLPLRTTQKVLVVVPDAPTRSDVQDDQLASSLLDAVRLFAPAAVGSTAGGAVSAASSVDVV